MGISVNSSSSGASRIRALERVRLMDPLARLPTKYPMRWVMAPSYPRTGRRSRCSPVEHEGDEQVHLVLDDLAALDLHLLLLHPGGAHAPQRLGRSLDSHLDGVLEARGGPGRDLRDPCDVAHGHSPSLARARELECAPLRPCRQGLRRAGPALKPVQRGQAARRDWSAASMRCAASRAIGSRSGVPETVLMIVGSKASTTVRPSSRRTPTLQGSSVAMRGSTSSARWASDGLQAPMMSCAPTSTPSLSARVCRRSIAVRVPNPWAASASFVAATASS